MADRFLEEYKRFPCLWKKSADFKNQVKRNHAEEVLLLLSGLGSVKIRNIRCTNNQEVAKIKKTMGTGSRANEARRWPVVFVSSTLLSQFRISQRTQRFQFVRVTVRQMSSSLIPFFQVLQYSLLCIPVNFCWFRSGSSSIDCFSVVSSRCFILFGLVWDGLSSRYGCAERGTGFASSIRIRS
ncbi:hypothetical protein CBL_12055 [Carabus blaptoides fortunei]